MLAQFGSAWGATSPCLFNRIVSDYLSMLRFDSRSAPSFPARFHSSQHWTSLQLHREILNAASIYLQPDISFLTSTSVTKIELETTNNVQLKFKCKLQLGISYLATSYLLWCITVDVNFLSSSPYPKHTTATAWNTKCTIFCVLLAGLL